MTASTYRRSERVVWRRGPDRVLVREVGAAADGRHADLLGLAALVWVALDEPMDVDGVSRALHDAEIEADRDAVASVCETLASAGWIGRPDPA